MQNNIRQVNKENNTIEGGRKPALASGSASGSQTNIKRQMAEKEMGAQAAAESTNIDDKLSRLQDLLKMAKKS